MNERRTAAATTLTYLVRSLLAVPESQRSRVVGPGAKPWCEILERTSRSIERDVRPVIVPLLSEIMTHAADLTSEQCTLAGLAARRMLEFGWNEPRRDRGMIRAAIEGVCRTFQASPAESAALIGRLLEPDHLAAHGFDELPTLAGELERLFSLAPALVERVYRAALLYREADESPTEIGDSLVMPLASNRRQDYSLALYRLAKLFPRFMETAPVEATGAAIAAVDAEVAKRAIVPVETIAGDSFQWGARQARFAEDLSHIWDASRHRQDAHFQILDTFEEGLVRLYGATGDPRFRRRVLDRVIRDNRFAALWRKVLSAAIRVPTALGREVWPLLAAAPILVAGDTVELAGKYLQVVFPFLGKAEREAIEQTILSIQSPDPERAPLFTRRKNRLLGCLAEDHVVTAEARTQIQELTAAGGAPPNAPLFAIGESKRQPYSEVQWLTDQGVQMDAGPNRRLHDLFDHVAKFERQFLNQAPTREEADAVVAAMRELGRILSQGGGGADPRVVESGWTHLTSACAAIALAEWLESEPGTAIFIRGVLLEAARHDSPQPDAERDENVERHGAIHPSPRWEAARGLLNIVRFPAFADADVVAAIRALSEDPVLGIRAEVGRHLPALYRTATEVFWELLRRVEGTESSRRVIHYTLTAARGAAAPHREEMLHIAHAVFLRFRDDPEASEVRCTCVSIILLASAGSRDPYGDELVSAIICDMARLTDEAMLLIQAASDRLTIGPVEPPDPQTDWLRQASFAFLQGFTRAVREWFIVLESRFQSRDATDSVEDTRRQFQTLHRLAHELGARVYFASGSFDEQMVNQQPKRELLTEEAKGRFLHEALPLLNGLSELAFPEVIHHVLQALEAYVDIDPRRVFLAVSRAVRKGQASGYQYDVLAVGLIVKLVRQYLADYRSLFRDDSECRNALTEVLNTFVRAGWPEAMGLTFRLEEIYR